MTARDFDAELHAARDAWVAGHPEQVVAAEQAAASDREWVRFLDWFTETFDVWQDWPQVWPAQPLIEQAWHTIEGGVLGIGGHPVYVPVEAERCRGWVIDWAVPGYDYRGHPPRALINHFLSAYPYDPDGIPEAERATYPVQVPREQRDRVISLLIAGFAARDAAAQASG